jgi:selenobiotic family peptide radical SAM maturase
VLRDRWWRGRKARTFTLQWHLTNACPYHCKHCYDRERRDELPLGEALRVLDDYRRFCRRHRVRPHVSLTGGDPLHYPHFWEVYSAVAAAGIRISILGNPIPQAAIQRLLETAVPEYYQVSLEGLAGHNDAVRGPGHFAASIDFLTSAEACGLRTHVMLTLTRDNLDQVIPLGEALRGRTQRLTFNRLARTGEGRNLASPGRQEYIDFLKRYLAARRENSILGFKDNLFNIIRHHYGRPLFPGCTGVGCGAAFSFVALLPDGAVHACRKFDSPIGDVRRDSFETVYRSARARAYRQGSAACRACGIRQNCGGCLAVANGEGLDPLVALDPHCFFAERGKALAGF